MRSRVLERVWDKKARCAFTAAQQQHGVDRGDRLVAELLLGKFGSEFVGNQAAANDRRVGKDHDLAQEEARAAAAAEISKTSNGGTEKTRGRVAGGTRRRQYVRQRRQKQQPK